MGRMADSAHQENMLSAARAGKFTKADLDAACALAAAGAIRGRDLQVLEPLRRLWPLFERSTKNYVFTADKAGEVAADMAALRKALED